MDLKTEAQLRQEILTCWAIIDAEKRAANALRAEVEALRALLAQTHSDRQREHDLRCRLAGEVEALSPRVMALEDRLLHHYDALSDWPLPGDHARDMCARIESMFPELFEAAHIGRDESK
jgi:hypothetical protein